ncbi:MULTISPECIES: cache domain-containing protein [unclassified Methanoculleus]|uniref:cache domain-containing protein n=1 Tax=unclassified Methanoculleus TaxID=2619537 RepID=UPI0025EF0685|nr:MULTISPECIES: cache domain-containing protein [unclassified Methanoculleus]
MSSHVYVCIIAALAILVAACAGCAAPDQPETASVNDGDAAALLIRLQSEITVALEDLDDRLAYAAFDLGETDLSGDDAHAVLANLSAADPSIVDCTVSDAGGTIIAAEPAAYRGIEGAEIRGQAHVRHILATKRPIMSEVITVAEDFPATVITAPVFTNESLFIGFASVVFRPENLIAGVAGPAANGTPYQVMVIQTDGRVLYDTDPAQVGKMTFEDPLYADYPDLLEVARRVADERYGTAAYEFTADGGQAVQKEIAWTTAGLHGVEWRVAVIRAV